MAKKKKLSNKKKELICNILLGIECILFINAVFNPWITADIFHIEFDKGGETIYAIATGLFIGFGIIMTIALSLLGFDFEPSPKETFGWTTKYKLTKFKNIKEFIQDFTTKAQKINYKLAKSYSGNDQYVNVYMAPKKEKKLDVIILTIVDEYNRETQKKKMK